MPISNQERRSSPLVSIVIPTRNRPETVCRAVRCALDQTYRNLEVVVVIDGPDPATLDALEALNDQRLYVIALPGNVGGSEARNTGVRHARGEWIAFLDDDDEWLPEKIERQLAAALKMPGTLSFVACQFVDRDHNGDRILPPIQTTVRGDFSEFLLCRAGLFGGTGYVQTSTWFVSRALAQQCGFTRGLKRNQDLDWMLRAMSIPGARFTLVTEPLSIFNSAQQAGRVSKSADWEFHYRWAMNNRKYLTKRALAYFLSTTCLEDAGKQGKRLSAAPQLLRAIVLYGRASFKSSLFFLYYFFFSDHLRQKWRSTIATFMHRGTRAIPCG